MIEPWINALAIGIFGFVTGAVIALMGTVYDTTKTLDQPARPDFSSVRNFVQSARDNAEQSQERWKKLPTIGKAGTLALYGLIIVLALVINYSPLEMNWVAYFVCLFAGAITIFFVFQAARNGKLRP